MPQINIYDASFVKQLFNEMSHTYGLTNYVSSFGFCHRWRKACVRLAQVKPGNRVYDLMSGMGECIHLIAQQLGGVGLVVALDFSEAMCSKAKQKTVSNDKLEQRVVLEDFLNNSIPTESADRIISCFGLKTFSREQMEVAAREVCRILKPGGRISLLEISVPPNAFLRKPYMFYLKRIIPRIGSLFLGNPDNYRMLGIYTEKFGSCDYFAKLLETYGLRVDTKPLFFGCATSIHGAKSAGVPPS